MGLLRVLVLSPVYNDWECAATLLKEIGGLSLDAEVSVLFVDDGSAEGVPAGFAHPMGRAIRGVSILSLNRNLGHQRAIAVGLAYAHQHLAFDAVVIMDSDGEDRPQDIACLLEAYRREDGAKITFARRRARHESLLFRSFYEIYLAVFRILVGFAEKHGNFSILSRQAVGSLAASSELWMHYASAVSRLKLRYHAIPIDRGTRYHGHSKMNVTNLIVHGLQAVAVHREVVAVRLFLASLISTLLLAAGMVVVVAIRFTTDLAIPGWATNLAGILAILMGQNLGFGLFTIFILLGGRSAVEFIPARDHGLFVREYRELLP